MGVEKDRPRSEQPLPEVHTHDEVAKLAAASVHSNAIERAEYFNNPNRVVDRYLRILGFVWPGFLWPWGRRTQKSRLHIRNTLDKTIGADPALRAIREAFYEEQQLIGDLMTNARRTFFATFAGSIFTFLFGVTFLVLAIVAAFLGGNTVEKAVLGGLSGGGAVATLSSVFATARDTIRKLNTEDAQMRLIIADLAMEIGYLKAERSVEPSETEASEIKASEINEGIDKVMLEAIDRIEIYVKENKGMSGRSRTPRRRPTAKD